MGGGWEGFLPPSGPPSILGGTTLNAGKSAATSSHATGKLLASSPLPGFWSPVPRRGARGRGDAEGQGEARGSQKAEEAGARASCFAVHGRGSAGAGSDNNHGVGEAALALRWPTASVASWWKDWGGSLVLI